MWFEFKNVSAYTAFERRVLCQPEASCLVFVKPSLSTLKKLSFLEVSRYSNQLAHYLMQQGVNPGDKVGICMESCPEMVIAILGVLKAGGCYVPLDPTYPLDRLTYMVQDSKISVLLSSQSIAQTDMVLDLQAVLPAPAQVVSLSLDDWQLLTLLPATLPEDVDIQPSDLAYIIYTSGSTGKPKGVMLTHQGICNLVMSHQPFLKVDETSRVLQFSSISFDAAVWEIFIALSSGAQLVLAERMDLLPGVNLLNLLRQQQITHTVLAPSALAALPTSDLPDLSHLLVAGEAVPSNLVKKWAMGRRFFNAYGPSEATVCATIAEITVADVEVVGPSIGTPIANTQVYVLDGDRQPVLPGEPGELYISGLGLALGYLNRPEKTAEAFISNPFPDAPSSKMYKTGDLVKYRADGSLDFIGRIDHQVKIRGFRIEPGEIEDVLSRHPQVRDQVVVVREDQPGQRYLAAYVVLEIADEVRLQANLDAEENLTEIEGAPSTIKNQLHRYLVEKLPQHMIPAAFTLLPLLPLTPNGKVDRNALPAPEWMSQAQYLAPQTTIEHELAILWQDCLKRSRVGVNDNFFDLGGNSLLLVRLHTTLQSKPWGQSVSVVDLFQYPTIASLAEAIQSRLLQKQVFQYEQSVRQQSFLRQAEGRSAHQSIDETVSGADDAIAIVSMSGRFPGSGGDLEKFWDNLAAGIELIRDCSDESLMAAGILESSCQKKNYVKREAVLEDIEQFDAGFFGLSPREAQLLDPQHRLLLECSWEVLERAGYDPEWYPGSIGLFMGSGLSTYLLNHIYPTIDPLHSPSEYYQAISATDKDFLASRIAYHLNLNGPAINVQTACSSALVAVHLACQSVLQGDCDMAIAGAASVRVPSGIGYLHQEGMILSPDGRCRPFDQSSQGTVIGNGAGVVLVKRLSQAIADGDVIQGVIKGSAINNDGALKVGYTAPGVDGQAAVIARAQAIAHVDPSTIGYLETHGTGTPLGDPVEITALQQAFQRQNTTSSVSSSEPYCALGSVKSNLGHLDVAAGIAGLIKAVLSLQKQKIPPSLHCETPTNQVDWSASPFYVNRHLQNWQSNSRYPRRAGVSAFGIGGTNAHVILEEAPVFPIAVERYSSLADQSQADSLQENLILSELLVLSAQTPAALAAVQANLAQYLYDHPELTLKDVAYTLAVGRKAFACRRAIVVSKLEDGAIALKEDLSGSVVKLPLPSEEQSSLIFLFPGQGSQFPEMGRTLYGHEPVFKGWIDRGIDLLKSSQNIDIKKLLYSDAHSENQDIHQALAQTQMAQVSLFLVEYALAQLWQSWGIRPNRMLGHSIGEYVAACVSGVFSFEDALMLVAERGRLMQSLPSGQMVAVNVSSVALEEWLQDHDGMVAIAAINTPDRCVLSGTEEAIAQLEHYLNQQEIEFRRLKTSHAFHSQMMDPMLDEFKQILRNVTLHPPTIPYLSNLTGTWATAIQTTDPNYWVQHVRHTVRFADNLKTLQTDIESSKTHSCFLEVGPGKTLSTLTRQAMFNGQTSPELNLLIVNSLPHPKEKASERWVIQMALGQLWQSGVSVNWSQVYGGDRQSPAPKRVTLPTYPFQRQRYWIERPESTMANGGTAQINPQQRVPATTKSEMDQWFYVPSWERSPYPVAQSPLPQCIILFANAHAFDDNPNNSLALLLEKQLKKQGCRIIRVQPGAMYANDTTDIYHLDPASAEDYIQLFADLQFQNLAQLTVLHLWSCSSMVTSSVTDMWSSQYLGFYSVLFLLQSIVRYSLVDKVQLRIVSNQIQSVTGSESLSLPHATLMGPLRTLAQEYPNLNVRHIDVALPEADAAPQAHSPATGQSITEQIAQQVIAELRINYTSTDVAYRGRYRWVQRYVSSPLTSLDSLQSHQAQSAIPIRQQGVYLITGGLGGVGLALAKGLSKYQTKLILSNRSDLPPRSDWNTWLASHPVDDVVCERIQAVQQIEAAGSEVLVLVADVSDQEGMRRVIEQGESVFGPIHGVIHAAGVVSPDSLGVMVDLDDDRSRQQLQPKLEGLLVLRQLLGKRTLDFWMLTSSLSTVLGGKGFAAYTAANCFLDACAHQYSQPNQPWISVDWDGWHVRSTRNRLSKTLEALAITPQEGVEVLQRILAHDPGSQVIISTSDLLPRLAQLTPLGQMGTEISTNTENGQATVAPQSLAVILADFEGSPTERAIAETWMQALGLTHVTLNDNFFSLGGDSLQALHVVSKLKEIFLVDDISANTLFEAPTVTQLAQVIEAQLEKVNDADDLSGVLDLVEQLSEEELADILNH